MLIIPLNLYSVLLLLRNLKLAYSLFSNSPWYTLFAPQILHKLLFSNFLGDTAYSQEHLKTIVYAKFGGQTKCIMGNSNIENCWKRYCRHFWYTIDLIDCALFLVACVQPPTLRKKKKKIGVIVFRNNFANIIKCYYMAFVCSRYNARSDWLIVTEL